MLNFDSLLNKCGKPSLDSITSFIGAHVDCADQVGNDKAEDHGWLHAESSGLNYAVTCRALRIWMQIEFASIIGAQ